MPQTNYTPILIYASSTTGNTPAAGNLTNSAGGAELAINYFDGRLFYKDASNVVQVLATKGTGTIGGSNTQVQFNSSGALAGSSNMTFNGTTLSVNGLTVTNNPTFNGGTANGVLYLNASKVVTSGSSLTFNGTELSVGGPVRTGTDGSNVGLYLGASSIRQAATGGLFIDANSTGAAGGIFFRDSSSFTTRMQIDASGNLGLGVTPSAWFTSNNFRAIQLTNSASVHGQLAGGAFLTGISSNWFANAAGTDTYIANGFATTYRQLSGQHAWYTAPSGTAGNAISFTQAMTLNAAQNLLLGTTTDLLGGSGNLCVAGGVISLFSADPTYGISRVGTAVTVNSAGPTAVTAGTNTAIQARNGTVRIETGAGAGVTERMRADTVGNVVINTAAIATNATDGFLYVPTCAGTPTGTPTAYTGRSPIVVNTTNNKLYFYSSGAWRDAGP